MQYEVESIPPHPQGLRGRLAAPTVTGHSGDVSAGASGAFPHSNNSDISQDFSSGRFSFVGMVQT